jgi:hypothetical protein
MAVQGFGTPLSQQGIKEFLTTGKLNGYLLSNPLGDDPNPPYKGVRGKGSTRIQDDVNFNIRIWEKIMVRYLRNLEEPMAIALRDELKKGESIVLEISPKYFSTLELQ